MLMEERSESRWKGNIDRTCWGEKSDMWYMLAKVSCQILYHAGVKRNSDGVIG